MSRSKARIPVLWRPRIHALFSATRPREPSSTKSSAPGLFSNLQGVVDADRRMGRFMLTGSSQFEVIETGPDTFQAVEIKSGETGQCSWLVSLAFWRLGGETNTRSCQGFGHRAASRLWTR